MKWNFFSPRSKQTMLKAQISLRRATYSENLGTVVNFIPPLNFVTQGIKNHALKIRRYKVLQKMFEFLVSGLVQNFLGVSCHLSWKSYHYMSRSKERLKWISWKLLWYLWLFEISPIMSNQMWKERDHILNSLDCWSSKFCEIGQHAKGKSWKEP